MPSQRQKNSKTFFWMKPPVVTVTALCMSIGPAIAIAAKHDYGWYGSITGLLLCALSVGLPLAALEIARRLDGNHETHRPPSGPPYTASGLDCSGAGDDYDGNTTPRR